MAGYSGTPFIKKLGYQSGETVCALRAPQWFLDELKNAGVVATTTLPAAWVHAFFTRQEEIATFLQEYNLKLLSKGLWVSWPKKASRVPTDITEQIFRDFILRQGWVDTKVCAVDATWSGLKFLRRTTKH